MLLQARDNKEHCGELIIDPRNHHLGVKYFAGISYYDNAEDILKYWKIYDEENKYVKTPEQKF